MSDTDKQPLTDREQEKWRDLVSTPHEDLTDEQVTSKIKLSTKRKYSAPEWALVFEFANDDGRRADAIAVNTFPSRNFKIVGFEFKASRSDWRTEKDDGAKADYFVQCVDEWYVVAGRRGIVEEKELPEGWGLLELKDNRDDQLWKLVESELTEYQQGGPDRAFWGRMLQKAIGETSNFTTADLEEARSRGYQEALDKGVERHVDREMERLERKAENWDALDEAGFAFLGGYGLGDERIERLNRAYWLVETIGEGGYQSLGWQVEHLQEDVDRAAEKMSEALGEFEAGLQELYEEIDEADGPEGDRI